MMFTERIGELNCTIWEARDSESPPECVVVLAHGFGAPGNDLLPLAGELLLLEPSLAETTRFVFPAAPLSLDSRGLRGGRAWWWIDLERRLEAIERGQLDAFRHDEPEGMAEASDLLLKTVEELLKQSGLRSSRLVLGGFSQGAMVALDVALRLAEPPAALAVLSGTLSCESRWKAAALRRGPLRVLLTHGQYDPILPYASAEWLRELFESAKFDVRFIPFPGQHEIPRRAVEGLAQLIKETIEG